MATKIGYVGRDASEQINWAEVGSNFSGILKEEARVREEKKAEIDRATREAMNSYKNTVTGDSGNMNTWALKGGDGAQQQLLMANSLLKSGQLKPKDYITMRQNLTDGFDQAMTLAQEYQNEYADKMERYKANPGTAVGPDGKPITGAQKLESFLMESAEGFGNFNNSEIVINNETGNVLVGFKDPATGKIETDPNKLVGINNLRNRIKGKFDAYDMASAVTKAKAEVFGQFQAIDAKLGTLYQKGLITTMSGAAFRSESNIADMVKKGYITKEDAKLIGMQEDTENLWAESQLSNVYNISSLLTNNLGGFASNGKEYTFTFDASEEDENHILVDQVDGNVVPNFDSAIGKAHRDKAKEGLITVLRGALNVAIEGQAISGATPPQRPQQQQWQALRSDERRDKYSAVGAWGKLYYGNESEQISATQQILGTQAAQNQGIYDVDIKSKPGYVILKFDGNGSVPKGSRSVPMIKANGEPIPYRDFVISGNQIHGVDNTEQALAASGGSANQTYYEKKTGRAIREQGQGGETYRDKIIKEVNTPRYKGSFQYGAFKDKEVKYVLQSINNQAVKFGGSVAAVEGSTTDFEVTTASGRKIIYSVNNRDNKSAQETRDSFLNELATDMSLTIAEQKFRQFNLSSGGNSMAGH